MRTIVYPHKVRAARRATAARSEPQTYRGRTSTSQSASDSPTAAEPDEYLARLSKHVPAEALAILLLFAGQLQSQSLGWRLAAVVFPCLIAVALDRNRRSRMDSDLRPSGVIYDLFVIAAFAAWALGTTDIARSLIGIDQSQASFVVVVVAFSLGFVDDYLGELFESDK